MECPKCKHNLPLTKKPKEFGGWFCPNCGLEIDTSGKQVKKLKK